MVEDALPSGWREVNDAEHDSGRYNPQPISRYEHGGTGVGIRLTPADPNAGTGNAGGTGGEGTYQVSVGADGSGDPSDMTAIGDASGHGDALGVAREFMGTYNDRCIDGGEEFKSVVGDAAGSN
ncbi:hypothetical protein BRD01_06295 [Halobacteriales archaeon QS_8_65_32]|nr:MAG: hypothetical protein BRD01_06295 [Halobacteriales archaeon QS_8_65_32]